MILFRNVGVRIFLCRILDNFAFFILFYGSRCKKGIIGIVQKLFQQKVQLLFGSQLTLGLGFMIVFTHIGSSYQRMTI